MRNANRGGAELAPILFDQHPLPLVIERHDPEVWDEWDRITAGLDKLTADGRAARLAELDSNPADLYHPHCVMRWREQVAAMDDMAGLPAGDAA
jgi:hypothetical protein